MINALPLIRCTLTVITLSALLAAVTVGAFSDKRDL
jgi:hypothetical protein